MLTLEETRRAKTAIASTDSALVANQSPSPANDSKQSRNQNHGNSSNSYNSRGKGKNSRHNYKGKNQSGNGSQKQNGRQQGSATPSTWTWVPYPQWPAPQQQRWTPPPCPYPTNSWTAPSNSSPGILGPRPQQAFVAQPAMVGTPLGAFVPTDIAAAMQTLTLQQPDDNLYMDTGASSHMTSNNGSQDGDADYEK
ncbi:hypothetical protein RND81_10G066100 [Saponaria officinalis]